MLDLIRSWCLRSAHNPSAPDGPGFRIARDVKASFHPDGVVLIHLGRGTVFSANRVGAMIWNGAVARWSLDRMAASVSNEFHIPPQTAQHDATEFLAQLAAEGLLITDGI